jgi:hypothetical protein
VIEKAEEKDVDESPVLDISPIDEPVDGSDAETP